MLICVLVSDAESEFEPTDGLVAFWPLTKRFRGRNLVSNSIDLDLCDVTFNDNTNKLGLHVAYFDYSKHSYAAIQNNIDIALNTSFSWMALIYRDGDRHGNAPLIEWHDWNNFGAQVWIWDNKFFVRVVFDSCLDQTMSHGAFVWNTFWHTVAVSYDYENAILSVTVNGEKQWVQKTKCPGNLSFTPNLQVNKR